MIFTGLYLESNPGCENLYVKEFFEVEIKVDVLLLRMVLDIVSKCLRQVEVTTETMDNSSFLNTSQRFDRSSILEDIEKVEADTMNRSSFMNTSSNFNASISSHRGLFNDSVVQNSSRGRSGFSFKIDLNATKNSQDETMDKYEQEEEDAFMKEDPKSWDVFKD